MSQGKSKLKDETDQPKLTEVWITPKPQRKRITTGEHKSRSRSVKRKNSTTPPTCTERKGAKRPHRDKMTTPRPATHTNQQNPDELKQTDPQDEQLKGIDQQLVTAIKILLQPIRDDVKTLIESHNEMKININELTKISEENQILHRRVEEVESKNKELTKRVCSLENKLLESSIVINGIQESTWETDAVREEKLFYVFSHTIVGNSLEDRLESAKSMYIKGSKRMGAYRTMGTRPIIVEFLYKADADYILNNRKYLGDGIYADRAYCKETEEARRILRPYLKAARKLPYYQKKCRLEEGTLVLRSLRYTPQDLDKLPAELSGFNISSTQDESTFGFFGNINPLSNFHPAKFSHEGNNFASSEQFIQYAKAKHFSAHDVASRILKIGNALECKRLANEIPNYDHESWKSVAKGICEPGITSKFIQNQLLQNMLLETGTKTIVECCRDPLWGTGIPFSDQHCLDRRGWRGQGIQGEMLESIRDKLRHISNLEQQMEQDSTAHTTEEPMAQGAEGVNSVET